MREFVRTAGGAGIVLTPTTSQDDLDVEAYEAEMDAAWGEPSQTLVEILDRGHSDVAIRPTVYSLGRVLPVDLESFVTDNTVRLRGWPVPYVDYQTPRQRHGTWVGQDIAARTTPHQEAWRMCGSGEFLHRRLLASSRSQSSELAPNHPDATGAVAVWDVLLYMVEVANSAPAWLLRWTSPRSLSTRRWVGLEGRSSFPATGTVNSTARISSRPILCAVVPVDSTPLLAETRQVGVELAQHLLGQFGLKVPDQVLLDWQAQVFDRR